MCTRPRKWENQLYVWYIVCVSCNISTKEREIYIVYVHNSQLWTYTNRTYTHRTVWFCESCKNKRYTLSSVTLCICMYKFENDNICIVSNSRSKIHTFNIVREGESVGERKREREREGVEQSAYCLIHGMKIYILNAKTIGIDGNFLSLPLLSLCFSLSLRFFSLPIVSMPREWAKNNRSAKNVHHSKSCTFVSVFGDKGK